MSEEDINLTHIASHPIRYKILSLLNDGKKPPYISQIAEKLEINNRLASFHLGVLRQHELAIGTWMVSEIPRSKGKAVKCFTITENAKRILEKIES